MPQFEGRTMTDHDRINYLVGKVAVLEALCSALIATHPNRSALRRSFSQDGEIPIAKLLPTHAPEAMIEGATETQAKIAALVSIEG